jgi:hypothetical protein
MNKYEFCFSGEVEAKNEDDAYEVFEQLLYEIISNNETVDWFEAKKIK